LPIEEKKAFIYDFANLNSIERRGYLAELIKDHQ
jgi:hypothetical protein